MNWSAVRRQARAAPPPRTLRHCAVILYEDQPTNDFKPLFLMTQVGVLRMLHHCASLVNSHTPASLRNAGLAGGPPILPD